MQEKLRETIDLFVANKEKIQGAFKWESAYIYPICSLMYTAAHAEADIDRMKEAEKLN